MAHPVTEQYGLGVLAWGPLASGWLSGAVREGRPVTTNRSGFMPQRFDIDHAIPMTVERFLMLSSDLKDTDARSRAASLRHRIPLNSARNGSVGV